ncbi:MAG: PAS domain S-box protein [Candidatus Dormibacteria bacterium]
MLAAPRAHRLPASLRRVAAGVASVPWRRRAFWITQLLVLVVVGVHVVVDRYGGTLARVPSVLPLALTVVPVWYAATKFGLRGSLPTAIWAVALMLPDILFLDTGLERWTHGSMLMLVLIVGVAAGRMVDVQRSSTAFLVAGERFRGIARVADQLPEGVCLTDLDGVITYVNPAWVRLQGLASPQAAVGRTLASLHPDQHADPGRAPFEQPLGAGGQLRSLVEHPSADGDSHWADVTVSALLDEHGQAIGRLSTVRDVTAERTAAAALQEAQERFRVTFEQAPLGMALLSLEGRVLQINDAFCQMLGRSGTEVMALGIHSLTHPADREPMRELSRRDGKQERFVKRCLHADGRFLSLQISSSLVSDAAGQPLYFVSQFRDVTEELAAVAALQEAEERFRLTFERAPLGMALVTPEGRFLQVNDALCRMVGRSAAEVIALGVAGITHPEDRELTQQVLQASGTREQFVKRYIHADGHLVSAQITASLVRDHDGKPLYHVAQLRDVTEELAAAAALQEAEERFRLTFERAPLGMALVTPEGRFLQVNDALCRMVGRSAAEVIALGVFGLTHPEDREATQQVLRQVGTREQFVKRYVHADGHLVSVQITASMVRDRAGKPLYFVSQFQDVTEEERSQLQLIQQAFHDPLTGLPNRVLFEDRVGQALARERRRHGLLAILFCDLDDFKAVNDRFGHQAGDEVLRSVAAALQGCVREADTVARFGGDEFVLLLDGVGEPAEATAAAARVHDALRKPHSLGGQEVAVGASIGIAINFGETASLETLLSQADTAMYQAKAAGGGCSRVFQAS